MDHCPERSPVSGLIGVPLVSLHPLRAPPPLKPGHKFRPFYTPQTLQPIPFFLTSPLRRTPESLENALFDGNSCFASGIDDSPTSMALGR